MKDNLLRADPVRAAYTVLRIAVAMCFIGHGAFGIITKPIWCHYFAVVGIGPALAYRIMPLVGSLDILLGVLMLVHPMRIIPAWLIMWGLATASMRPLSGEPFAELIERAGNFGAPLALLLLMGLPQKPKDWFTPINRSADPDPAVLIQVTAWLRIIGCLLLAGHGWLNLLEKEALLKQYSALGFADPVRTAQLAGILEIAGGGMILVKPLRPLLLGLLVWKAGSELFYPQHAFFEWVERGGSYGTLLALWMLTAQPTVRRSSQLLPNRALTRQIFQ